MGQITLLLSLTFGALYVNTLVPGHQNCVCPTCLEDSAHIRPPLHPDAIMAIDANDTLSFLGEMDPLPEVPITIAAADLHGVSVHAWLATRMMWHMEDIRGDIKQAVQSAELVNLAYAQGDEPHPLVDMLATSDPIDTTRLDEHFAREARVPAAIAVSAVRGTQILRRAFWWILGSLSTIVLLAIGVAADVLTRL